MVRVLRPGGVLHLLVEDIAQHYVVVDTLRVPRETFAGIWAAWRAGFRAVTEFAVDSGRKARYTVGGRTMVPPPGSLR